MAKNISKNQWFKDIIDDVYLETAVVNNILLITVHSNKTIAKNTVIATLRNPSLFEKDSSSNKVVNYTGHYILVRNNELVFSNDYNTTVIGSVWLMLKSRQLETDFYTPEQLAEMYPDDPAYQVATADLPEGDNPTLSKVDLQESGSPTPINTDSITTAKKKSVTKP